MRLRAPRNKTAACVLYAYPPSSAFAEHKKGRSSCGHEEPVRYKLGSTILPEGSKLAIYFSIDKDVVHEYRGLRAALLTN